MDVWITIKSHVNGIKKQVSTKTSVIKEADVDSLLLALKKIVENHSRNPNRAVDLSGVVFHPGDSEQEPKN